MTKFAGYVMGDSDQAIVGTMRDGSLFTGFCGSMDTSEGIAVARAAGVDVQGVVRRKTK